MENIFSELSLILVLAAVVAFIMNLLRQPLILGYILTGLLVGPTGFDLIHSRETFEGFSSIGISLLLFIIGLGLNIAVIKKLGKPVFITAAVELFTIGSVGFVVSTLLGFRGVEALIIGLALFFSSTIIIVKVLTDKKEQSRLHGQIAIGIILIDDIIATLALLFVTAGKGDSIDTFEIGTLLLKGGLLISLLFFVSSQVLPRLGKLIASSQELLFLFAISWGFGIASLFERAGFSIEVGALFAGVALASLPYAQEIGARLKPLRDFFVVLFFIVLGESLNVTNIPGAILPALALSAIVIILKPIIITTTLGVLGYTKRVSFKTGINLSQISEFSIVLVVFAASSGVIDPTLTAIITLVAIITIATSTYLMHYDEKLFARFDKMRFRLFEREGTRKETIVHTHYPLILFGYQKGGHEFIRTFKHMKKRFVVVDYDPEVIDSLERQRIPYVYGDASDVELLDEVGVHTAKLIISTVTDFEINQQLVKHVSQYNPQAVIITSANNTEEAMELYALGSSYVMIPHYIGGEKISAFIRQSGLRKRDFKDYKDKHLKYLDKHFGVLVEPTEEHKKKLGRAILQNFADLSRNSK